MNDNNFLQQGRIWLQQNRPDRAAESLRQSLSVDPEDPQAHALLSLCWIELKEQRRALEEAETAIGLAPDWSLPYYARACAFHNLGRKNQAEQAVKAALDLDPEDPQYYALLSAVCASKRQGKKALEAAEKGLALDPEDMACTNARAAALILLGKGDEADLRMEAALHRDPEDAETHVHMGWSKLHQGKIDDAMEHFKEALALEPDMEYARAGLVEAMKGRNKIYRVFLSLFLWMTRLDSRMIVVFLISTIVIRYAVLRIAQSVPLLAPVLWPLYWGLALFILMTWIADPLFNLILRLDRFGRHALSRRELRQSNWLGFALLLTCFLGILYFLGIPRMGLAAIYTAVITIPLMRVFEVRSPGRVRTMIAITLGFVLVAAASVYLEYSLAGIGKKIETIQNKYQLTFEESNAEEELARLTDDERNFLIKLGMNMGAFKSRRETANTLISLFLYGFVAFTWLSHLITSGDEPE